MLPKKDLEAVHRQDIKAFLQVQLTRHEKSYIVNYEVRKEGFSWKITNEI